MPSLKLPGDGIHGYKTTDSVDFTSVVKSPPAHQFEIDTQTDLSTTDHGPFMIKKTGGEGWNSYQYRRDDMMYNPFKPSSMQILEEPETVKEKEKDWADEW